MKEIALIVGERIQAYRKSAGLTQERLAEKAELHHTYIGQLERGEKNATLETIQKIAKALDVSFETLLEKIVIGEVDNPIAREAYNLIAKLSVGQAAAFAGMDEVDFIRFLGQHRVSIFGTASEIAEDFANA